MDKQEFRKKYNSEGKRFPIVREETEKELIKIIEQLQPVTILELGTGVGFSGCSMLDACKTASLLTVESDKVNYEEALNNFSQNDMLERVMPVNASAEDVVQSLANYGQQTFDLIFLDCSKSSYNTMISNLTMLLSSGGVLFADNVLFFGKVKPHEAITSPEQNEEYLSALDEPHKHRTTVKNLRQFINFCETCTDFASVQVIDKEDGFLVAIKK